ncbi:alpha-1,2-mannosidase, putative subfamily [Lineolata rhizophorae]|uniref:Alpha-1,2-mannosidase, putative subfamily n=1 Tax=Lineolata rhizophorae TaxID=578093 RepID=A0A6A6P5C0_9PEZI|nr:alpha-1,2-mannosidase, putative subfamily [Lineolata rhizophorae]
MVKAVADVDMERHGGFSFDGMWVTGFSHMHDSGTGGSPSLGNYPLFPVAGCENNNLSLCQFNYGQRQANFDPNSVEAFPGYFGITLESGIKVDMTVSAHTALYRFKFPVSTSSSDGTALSPLIMMDFAALSGSVDNPTIFVNNNTGRITGTGTFSPSFGIGNFVLHVCADFEGGALSDAAYFNVFGYAEEVERLQYDQIGGGFVRFEPAEDGTEILARVGLSFISSDQACQSAANEIPDFNFDDILAAAQMQWKEKLSVVELDTEGASEDLVKTFWSGIYRTMISPQDYTGENQLWTSSEPYYDSFYCIWDSFRSQHPLLTLLDPPEQTRMVRALIDIYRHEGKLPDCRMSFSKGYTQGGSNADIVLADSYLKGIREGVDWETGYEAVVSDAEEVPSDWRVEGRGDVPSWWDIRYTPKTTARPRSVSRTVEYAYDDFGIAQIAEGLGYSDSVARYTNSSRNWQNLWKTDQTSMIDGLDTGFEGFLQPRNSGGDWQLQDPIFCSPLYEPHACYLGSYSSETYEGPIWLYSFFAPHDMAALIQKMGGQETFIKRLDFLHDSGLLDVGNEQSFLMHFLYHYAGRPALSAARLHHYIPGRYHAAPDGLPGNDDSGAMGAFLALSMMGIFPNPGQDVYFITPPFFREVHIKNKQTGNIATIRNVNFDPAYRNIYIQSATLNGEPYSRNWITHSLFLEGGTLELVLGHEESVWGTSDEDRPPSLQIIE